MQRITTLPVAALLLTLAAPAAAAERAIEITRCPAPLGTMAVAEGDMQGWTRYGLGSPRELIGAIVESSGCFTLHDPNSTRPADYLLVAVAGDRAEIDRTVHLARAGMTEAALRSGLLGRVPVVGGALGLMRGFGGQRRTVTAGLRVMDPANGRTLAAGTGQSSRASISWGQQAQGEGRLGTYTSSRDGRLVSAAFAAAFNEIAAQSVQIPPRQAPEPTEAIELSEAAPAAATDLAGEAPEAVAASSTPTPAEPAAMAVAAAPGGPNR
ncbi:hypothetical protein [Sphingosinicella terrae]|uniref:hypothetical protein n=1 Tax=Sphingosinicella terrae TaxID=2172047 RepID=UPI000E0D570A|nr:hypothetical protein [Sphingosinicella terrae]